VDQPEDQGEGRAVIRIPLEFNQLCIDNVEMLGRFDNKIPKKIIHAD